METQVKTGRPRKYATPEEAKEANRKALKQISTSNSPTTSNETIESPLPSPKAETKDKTLSIEYIESKFNELKSKEISEMQIEIFKLQKEVE